MGTTSWFSYIKKTLLLAIPLIISNVAMIGMEVIDTIMAGQASAEDLAGLAIGGNIWLVLEIGTYGVILAVTPRLAKLVGENNKAEITIEAQQSLLLASFIGFIAMLIMFAAIPLIPLLGANEEVTIIAQGYTEIIAYSLPISGVCWALFGLLEAHGLVRFVMFTSLGAVTLNLIFDYLFVFGKFGFPALGGIGCAWTTTVIYWLWGAVFIVYTLKHPTLKTYKIFSNWPGVILARWRGILGLGLPISLALLAEEGFFSFSALLIAPLGTEPLAAHQITIQIVALVLMVGLGIGQATAIYVAKETGKLQTTNVRNYIHAGVSLVLLFGVLVGLVVFVLRDQLPYLFTQSPTVAFISTAIMFFAPLYLVLDILQIWAAQTLRGFEDTKVPMIIQVTSYWVIGFPLGYSLGNTDFWGTNYGVYGFWIGIFSGISFGSIFLSLRLYSKTPTISFSVR
jgi:MATE family multidrug resistance protein